MLVEQRQGTSPDKGSQNRLSDMCVNHVPSTGWLEGGVVGYEFLAKETVCPKAGTCMQQDLLGLLDMI